MVIISILHNRLQVLQNSSLLFGKKQDSHASVTIPIDKAEKFDIDIWALYLKKVLEESGLTKSKKQQAHVILGERFFEFARVDIPLDITPDSMYTFVEDQLTTLFPHYSPADTHQYFLSIVRGKTIANIYLLTNQNKQAIHTLLDFFDIHILSLYPESLLIFETFNHTLNTTKKERVFFLEYEPKSSSGLYFDTHGLVENTVYTIDSAELESELRKVAKSATKPTRLILSGAQSLDIRQDSFTKAVGIWTNPLHRILSGSPLLPIAQQHHLDNELLVMYAREIVLLSHIAQKTTSQVGMIPNVVASKRASIKLPSNIPARRIITILAFIAASTALSFFALRQLLLHPLALSLSVSTITLPALPHKAPSATPTARPTTKSTPTPKLSISAENIPIIIENGEGSAGLANTYKTRLEEKGYTITRVANADNYAYTVTVIQAKNKDVFNRVAKDLSSYLSGKPTFEKSPSSTATVILGADSL